MKRRLGFPFHEWCVPQQLNFFVKLPQTWKRIVLGKCQLVEGSGVELKTVTVNCKALLESQSDEAGALFQGCCKSSKDHSGRQQAENQGAHPVVPEHQVVGVLFSPCLLCLSSRRMFGSLDVVCCLEHLSIFPITGVCMHFAFLLVFLLRICGIWSCQILSC